MADGEGHRGAAGPPAREGRLARAWSNPAYRFALLFVVYLGVIAALYPRVRMRWPATVDTMALLTARLEHAILRLATEATTLSGKVVVYDGFAVKIIEECTGIYEALIFAAAVLAFPTSWRKKAIGLAGGVPVLYLFNVIRILVLVLVGRHWPDVFDFMHLYFWQATLILMITSVWLVWIFKVVRD